MRTGLCLRFAALGLVWLQPPCPWGPWPHSALGLLAPPSAAFLAPAPPFSFKLPAQVPTLGLRAFSAAAFFLLAGLFSSKRLPFSSSAFEESVTQSKARLCRQQGSCTPRSHGLTDGQDRRRQVQAALAAAYYDRSSTRLAVPATHVHSPSRMHKRCCQMSPPGSQRRVSDAGSAGTAAVGPYHTA